MSDAIDTLQDAVDAAKALPSESEKAVAFHDNVLPAMDALRAAADDAETICGEDYWPLPSYSKMPLLRLIFHQRNSRIASVAAEFKIAILLFLFLTPA